MHTTQEQDSFTQELSALAHQYEPDLIKLRRSFHAIPEVAYEEVKTTNLIEEELNRLGLTVARPLDTGVVATITGTHPSKPAQYKTIALRADIDALCEQEETGVSYASTHPHRMHACGHDCHIACLITCARLLCKLKHHLPGDVKLIFQPAEEGANGAEAMIEAGALKDVDAIFGLHVWSGIEHGVCAIAPGPLMAAADWFSIKIHGTSGHGSRPHEARDVILAGSALVQAINSMIAREIDPQETAVVSICEFHAGNAKNILPEYAQLTGTIRSFTPQMREYLPAAIRRICSGIEATYRVSITFSYTQGNDPVINDHEVTQIVKQSVVEVLGSDYLQTVKPITPGEDFAAYLRHVPGAFMLLGITDPEQNDTAFPIHSSHFNVDERALIQGALVEAQVAYRLLRAHDTVGDCSNVSL